MISLSVGHHNIQLTTHEAAYLAEGLWLPPAAERTLCLHLPAIPWACYP